MKNSNTQISNMYNHLHSSLSTDATEEYEDISKFKQLCSKLRLLIITEVLRFGSENLLGCWKQTEKEPGLRSTGLCFSLLFLLSSIPPRPAPIWMTARWQHNYVWKAITQTQASWGTSETSPRRAKWKKDNGRCVLLVFFGFVPVVIAAAFLMHFWFASPSDVKRAALSLN